MDNHTAATNHTLPWYRAPVLWLAVALPALTVVAGVVTYIIAADGFNDAEPDAVRRVAQVQISDLHQDETAARLGLSAHAAIDPVSGRVRLSMNAIGTDANLQLILTHKSQARRDQVVRLTASSGGDWIGVLPSDHGGAFNVSLVPASALWRLVGSLEPNAERLLLLPALGRGHE
ncbi:MAG: FixH family protein [Pseudomonadota bacterium]|nr:FixH family protein [Pseudomonadota bacterium]